METSEVEKLTVKELVELCKSYSIKGYTNRTKQEMIRMITDHFSPPLPPQPKKRRANSLDMWVDDKVQPSTADTYWIPHGKMGDAHGKWMIFIDRANIDQEWKKFKQLYNEAKLGPIVSMKVSGAKPNPRASSTSHVIIFYCPDDQEAIMDIGRHIVSNLVRYSNPYIYYKSNEQTRQGTVATGSTVNHLYKLSTRPVEATTKTRQVIRIGYDPSLCGCGRRNEEGSTGCTRFPGCLDSTWY